MGKKANKTLFEQIISSSEYQAVLSELPDDEKKELLSALKNMVDDWEKNVLIPLQNMTNK